jgi:lysophospholipase L1-like esterase
MVAATPNVRRRARSWAIRAGYLLFLVLLLEVTAQLVVRITTGVLPIMDVGGPNAELFAPHPYLVGMPRAGKVVERGGAKATINALGYRGGEIERRKPVGVRRIVALGGSTTFGVYVDDRDTWPSRLQKTLGGDFEVINAGVPGFTSAENLIQLSLLAVHLKPDFVVLFQGLNDLRNANTPGLSTDYTNFHAPTLAGGLELHSLQRGRRIGIVRLGRAALVRLFGAPTPTVVRQGQKRERADDLALSIFRSNLRTFAGICEAHEIQCIFVPQVVSVEYPVDEWWMPFVEPSALPAMMDEYNEIMRSVVAAEGSLVFAEEVASHHWTAEDFLDYCHFSARGGERFARLLEHRFREGSP